jgi:hypothetical protein
MGRFRPSIDDSEEESDQDEIDLNEQALVVSSSEQPESPFLSQPAEIAPTSPQGFIQTNDANGHRIHPYDCYYSPPNQQRRISPWWWVALAAIVAHVVARYGPPAPPKLDNDHHDLNWGEFFELEWNRLYKALGSLLSTIPYVGRWCWQGLYEDVAELFQPAPCAMLLPESLDWTRLVGQPVATAVLSDALDAWDRRGPLLLLHSGTIGVGKLELARQIANVAFQHCTSDPQAEALVIRGDEYGKRMDFGAIISTYISKRPQGGVIILQHIEKLALQNLIQILQSIRRLKSKLIVFATTHVGSRTIHKSLKQPKQFSKLELDLSLRHEIDLELETDLTHYFHAVAPFVPLGPKELQLILLQQASEWSQRDTWKQLRLSSTLAEAWTDSSHIEYLVLRNKGQDVLVFSSLGAKALTEPSPLYNKLAAQLKRCFGAVGKPEHVADMDYDEHTEEGVFRWCTPHDEQKEFCEEACRFHLTE